jgi:hypothetical protein
MRNDAEDSAGQAGARERWIKKCALHLIDDLPDAPDLALAVLDEAARVIQEYLAEHGRACARVCGSAGYCPRFQPVGVEAGKPWDLASLARSLQGPPGAAVLKMKR